MHIEAKTSISPDAYGETSPDTLLGEEDKNTCEDSITIKDCVTVIQNLKLNKSPGLDGLTPEFDQTFWEDIAHILVEFYNESFQIGNCQKVKIYRSFH